MLLQFEAFAKGFMMLCGGPAIHLFSATEIERLVCGNPILDFLALQNNARYDGGFTADHRVRAVQASSASASIEQTESHGCIYLGQPTPLVSCQQSWQSDLQPTVLEGLPVLLCTRHKGHRRSSLPTCQ